MMHKENPPERVRMAVPSDTDAIMRLMRLSHEECALAPFSEERVLKVVQMCTNPDPQMPAAMGVIPSDDGNIEAIIGLRLGQWWYSDQWHVEDFITFVHPDYRHGKNHSDLISFAKWFSDSLGIMCILGILQTGKTEAKIRLWRKHMPCVGAIFAYGSNIRGHLSNYG